MIKNPVAKNWLYLALTASRTFLIISNNVNIGNNCKENRKWVFRPKHPKIPKIKVHIKGKISGLNKAIKKVVLITEIVKSKIPGLHQINEINTLYKQNNEINQNDISNENGMPRMSIKLTFVEPSEEEKNNMGYQRPLNAIEASMISKYRNNINNEDYE